MTGSADNARRAPVVSRLVTAPRDEMPPAAQKALLTDRNDDRRVVLVELRLRAGDDVRAIRQRFLRLFREVFANQRVPRPVPVGRHYMRCVLTREQVAQLVGNGAGTRSPSVMTALELIYHIWPDLIVEAHLDRSLTTIKADAASRTYACGGAGVVWAVLDSGIDGRHPHFATHGTAVGERGRRAAPRLHRSRHAERIPRSTDRRVRPRHPHRGHHRRARHPPTRANCASPPMSRPPPAGPTGRHGH